MCRRTRWIRRLIRGGLCLAAVWVLLWFALPFAVPLPSALMDEPAASPTLLDRHGAVLARLTLPDDTRSAPVALGDIPPDFLACTLAAEDKRFYSHGGIDVLATCRAVWQALRHGRATSGASTITQQLIKITSPPAKRNLTTKLRESLAARRLEMCWSKSQILAAYLNRLNYGCRRLGPQEATRWYFQKPMADLSLSECALLAGLPQAPTRLNPLANSAGAHTRRNTVLQRLATTGKFPAARIDAALVEPVTLRPLREDRPAPWLPAHLAGTPTTVRTTLDLPLQQAVATIVSEETAKLAASNLRHAAVVVLDHRSGEILALVSSADWNDPRGGQINGALVPRSLGSALKPFTYLLALQRLQATPTTLIADIPSPFRTPQGLDLPENYDRTYRGPVTVRTALACSLNVPALRVLNDLGGPQPLADLLEKLGVLATPFDCTTCGLGLTLGNAPVRLLDLTNAYAALARGGAYLPPRLLADSPAAAPVRIATPAEAWQITHILADPAARAPAFGASGAMNLPFPCAVKTGTSSDFRDNWCFGYTTHFAVGVWAGNFEGQPMKGISGVTGAAPILHRVMMAAHGSAAPEAFPRPPGLTDFTADVRTGRRLADSAWPEQPHARREIAPAALVPPPAAASDYDASGRALLPPLYAAWFHSNHNLRRAEFALDPTPAQPEPLRIVLPADGTTYLLDPEIPSGSDRLRPVTNLPGVARWTSPTLRIEPATPEPVIHLSPGTHTLTATDPRTGESHTLTLTVKEL